MKNVIITVLSIAVIVLGGYLVYDKVIDRDDKVKDNNKVEENIGDNNSNNENNNDTITEYVGVSFSKSVDTEWEDDINNTKEYLNKTIELFKILLNTENVTKLNDKIYNDYKDDIDNIAYQGSKPISLNISYEYAIKDNILSIVIKHAANSPQGSGYTHNKGYYYDIKNDKELTLDEVCNLFNITLNNVKSVNFNISRIDEVLVDETVYSAYYDEVIQNEIATIKY